MKKWSRRWVWARTWHKTVVSKLVGSRESSAEGNGGKGEGRCCAQTFGLRTGARLTM